MSATKFAQNIFIFVQMLVFRFSVCYTTKCKLIILIGVNSLRFFVSFTKKRNRLLIKPSSMLVDFRLGSRGGGYMRYCSVGAELALSRVPKTDGMGVICENRIGGMFYMCAPTQNSVLSAI